jgi:FkbM family methyltransferase
LDDLVINDRLIYDLGMHTGEDTTFYLKKGFSVVAVEANPDLCALCEARLGQYVSAGKLKIINAAIYETTGQVTFYVNDRVSAWGTVDKSWAQRNERLGTKNREITVKSIRLQDLIEQHGTPYYMKIDIEGADMICLDSLRANGDRPKFLSIESSTKFEDVAVELAKLWDLGYRKFKVVPQHRVPKQVCPAPPREGVFVEHQFRFGSSGLFGQELPGRWLTIDEVRGRFKLITLRNRLLGFQGVTRTVPVVRAATNLGRTSSSPYVRKAYHAVRAGLGAIGLRPSHYDTHAML